jgi:hypothetical protein
VKLRSQPITRKSFSKKFTFIELTPKEIVLDSTIIRRTKQALLDKQAVNGFLFDDKNQFALAINPHIALDILQVHPPIVMPVDKKSSLFGLVANYGLIHLLKQVASASPLEKIHCLFVERCSDADLAHLYASTQFANNCLADNIAHQEWDAGRLHDCFIKRPSDSQFAQFLKLTIKRFRDMRAAQNRVSTDE